MKLLTAFLLLFSSSIFADLIDVICNETHRCIIENEHAEKIHSMINELGEKNVYEEHGADDLRIRFVPLQGAIEHVLACQQVLGEVRNLIGMIHTPTPATPLCTFVENVDWTVLDASIRGDLDKRYTVSSRAEIVRQYLYKGAKLFVVYPEKGLLKRSEKQQAVFREELKKFPENLLDAPLSIEAIDSEMIGALYLFEDKEGQLYAFSIKAKQANDPHEDSHWALWLGKVEGIVKNRVEAVLGYFDSVGGPKLR